MTNERRGYAWLAGCVLVAEVIIALFVDDRLVRPLVGDALAVILVYLTLRAALSARVLVAVIIALLVATLIEFGQMFGLLSALGLESNALARVVLGSSYDPRDFVAYAAGAGCILAAERLRSYRRAGSPRRT